MQILMQPHYYGIDELKGEWCVCANKLKHWLINGELQSHLWLPIMSVYSLSEAFGEASRYGTHKLEHFEGFVPLTRHHCQRLYRSGKLTIRDFSSLCGKNRYQLPDSSDDICVGLDDLLILEQERERFESSHSQPTNETTHSAERHSGIDVSKDFFRSIHLNGQTHYFGPMQAEILYLLYEASLSGDSWQNGKLLLQAVGSESFTLSNIFKHKPIWKQLIESNGRGFYRIHPELARIEAWTQDPG